jgi:hypothetical protein
MALKKWNSPHVVDQKKRLPHHRAITILKSDNYPMIFQWNYPNKSSNQKKKNGIQTYHPIIQKQIQFPQFPPFFQRQAADHRPTAPERLERSDRSVASVDGRSIEPVYWVIFSWCLKLDSYFCIWKIYGFMECVYKKSERIHNVGHKQWWVFYFMGKQLTIYG